MDIKFWDKVYSDRNVTLAPSTFSEFCCKRFLNNIDCIIDLGCGNGRDSFCFLDNGFKVIALDQCDEAMKISIESIFSTNDLCLTSLQAKNPINTSAQGCGNHSEKVSVKDFLGGKGFKFFKGDFSKFNFEGCGKKKAVYSRFTLHSISLEQEDSLLYNLSKGLNLGDLFLIEARTVNDPLCGVGEKVGHNEYITDHYRRFIDSNEFINKVMSQGFSLCYFVESNGLSVYKDDDPVLMRLVLKKT